MREKLETCSRRSHHITSQENLIRSWKDSKTKVEKKSPRRMNWKRDGRNTQRLSTWKSPHCPQQKHDEIAPSTGASAILTSLRYKKAIREFKKGKSPGSDDIPIELLSATEWRRFTTHDQTVPGNLGYWRSGHQDWKEISLHPNPQEGSEFRVCSN